MIDRALSALRLSRPVHKPSHLTWAALVSLAVTLVLSSTAFAAQPPPDTSTWLRSGPMSGYSEIQSTVLWLQTRDVRRVSVRYWPVDVPEDSRLSAPLTSSPEHDFIVKVPLTGLRFGSEYAYELYLDGWPVALPEGARFQTQPMWRWRTDPPEFTFALGSCAYLNHPPFDRPGRPYGSDSPIFDQIAEQKVDFMLWLGDNLYLREADWLSPEGMRHRYARDRSVPSLQRLLAGTHHYAVWDDHDYGPNNSDRTFRHRQAALEIFNDYWANAASGTLETPGIFHRFEWGDVEFFLLDDRFYRSPNTWPADDSKQIFGPAQLRWLKESLQSSLATFKIIVGGSQFLNEMIHTPEKQEVWHLFPAEKQSFMDFLLAQRIDGVLFLSGDRHHTELLKKSRPGSYPLYDFTSSPLTAGTSNAKNETNNPLRVPGTWVQHRHNFGKITVSGPADDRKLLLQAVASDGEVFWRYEIARSSLTTPED